ncbi:MAG: hypothetical protein ACP6IQ_03930 [Candidatus Njordarchaeia archaeon]|nr:hypothetical protein [Candidatus Korarchaeota archaeon]
MSQISPLYIVETYMYIVAIIIIFMILLYHFYSQGKLSGPEKEKKKKE